MFLFLSYVSPLWYFHLKPIRGDKRHFVNYSKLEKSQRDIIAFDYSYSCRESSLLDAAYQSWHKGIVHESSDVYFDDELNRNIPDNYRFLRRYFSPAWSWYVLVLRLLMFNNPIYEVLGFIKNRNVKRLNLYEDTYPHEKSFLEFQSPLLKSSPRVSVIIPTLNRYFWLKDALKDLERQCFKNFEVIIVDQSDSFQPSFYDDFKLDIKVCRQKEKALWLARNSAIRVASGNFIVMYEDDVRVPRNWLSSHLKCIDYFDVDISAGVFFPEDSDMPVYSRSFRWAEQFATGNACLKREVFEKVGLFDRQFEKQRMGDGEFGLRAYLSGFKSISNPIAYCKDIKADQGGLRQMGSWDAYRPVNLLAPRPIPSVLYFTRKYFGTKAAYFSLIKAVPPSLISYRYKRNSLFMFLGYFLVLLFLPFVIYQVRRSWLISTQMLKDGAKIQSLDKRM